MKITFPHLGNTYICVKPLLDELNIDCIIPPFNNREALELGTRHAPECCCLPLKINIGNYLQAYKKGADTILMAGGCGPCRFGYYCELQREILEDMGIDMKIIVLEAPYGNVWELVRRIVKLTGAFNLPKIIWAFKNASRIAISVDKLEKLCFKIRPRELNKGETDGVYKKFRTEALSVKGFRGMEKHIAKTFDELNSIKMNKSIEPLKIGIVGEIYTTVDSNTNFNIEARLGNLGIQVDRSVTVSGWIVEHMIKKALPLPRDMEFAKAAYPYLGAMIGGHARETVGNTVLYAKNNYDGIIQIYPLTCMPEIVAESILPAVEKDYDIPVMTLIIDEMTGEAGYMTRVEAFADLLESRRNKNTGQKAGFDLTLRSGNI